MKKIIVNKEKGIFLVGKQYVLSDVEDVYSQIKAIHAFEDNIQIFRFFRCLVGDTLLYSSSYQRTTKQLSYVIAYSMQDHSLCYGEILYFVRICSTIAAVIKPFDRLGSSCMSFFKLSNPAMDCDVCRIVPVTTANDGLHIINVENIVQKCLLVCVSPNSYVCVPPNYFMHD